MREELIVALVAPVAFALQQSAEMSVYELVGGRLLPHEIHCYANLRLLIERCQLCKVPVQHTVVTCEHVTEGLCVGWE